MIVFFFRLRVVKTHLSLTDFVSLMIISKNEESMLHKSRNLEDQCISHV